MSLNPVLYAVRSSNNLCCKWHILVKIQKLHLNVHHQGAVRDAKVKPRQVGKPTNMILEERARKWMNPT